LLARIIINYRFSREAWDFLVGELGVMKTYLWHEDLMCSQDL